jgi:hypothetical protein
MWRIDASIGVKRTPSDRRVDAGNRFASCLARQPPPAASTGTAGQFHAFRPPTPPIPARQVHVRPPLPGHMRPVTNMLQLALLGTLLAGHMSTSPASTTGGGPASGRAIAFTQSHALARIPASLRAPPARQLHVLAVAPPLPLAV